MFSHKFCRVSSVIVSARCSFWRLDWISKHTNMSILKKKLFHETLFFPFSSLKNSQTISCIIVEVVRLRRVMRQTKKFVESFTRVDDTENVEDDDCRDLGDCVRQRVTQYFIWLLWLSYLSESTTSKIKLTLIPHYHPRKFNIARSSKLKWFVISFSFIFFLSHLYIFIYLFVIKISVQLIYFSANIFVWSISFLWYLWGIALKCKFILWENWKIRDRDPLIRYFRYF